MSINVTEQPTAEIGAGNSTPPSVTNMFLYNKSGSTDGDGFDGDIMTSRDASWILTSAVIIFTMQTGFGLLEAGCVSSKSEINIMIKNALDVVFGGLTYWAFGFGLSFGRDEGTNGFIGIGNFFLACDEEEKGFIYALFLFQLSFSTTATTIVSGAMAERTKLLAYNLFSLVNTFIYCLPAHWVWAESGFLFKLGVIDVAGCGPVHLCGGVTGLVATLILGPRRSALEHLKKNQKVPIPGSVKCILGMFMLWWGWLRFNSGSVFIVSTSSQWKYAVTAAVNTIIASMGGGVFSVAISLGINRVLKRSSKYDVGTIISGVLGALVSITSICTLCLPWEAFVIGSFAPFLTSATELLLIRLRIDDPVGVIPVHLVCSVWGLLCVGLFIQGDANPIIRGEGGLFKTGQWYLLGVQTLCILVISVWTALTSMIFLKLLGLVCCGIRLSKEEEEIGADVIEHGSITSMFGFGFHQQSTNLKRLTENKNRINMMKSSSARLHAAEDGLVITNTAELNPSSTYDTFNHNQTGQNSHYQTNSSIMAAQSQVAVVSNHVSVSTVSNGNGTVVGIQEEVSEGPTEGENQMTTIMTEFFTTCERMDMSVTLSRHSTHSVTFEITNRRNRNSEQLRTEQNTKL